ncbi:MAG: hypothetical protein ACYCO0_05310 [Candidatus Micrarchaeaceae archaeon]
MTDETDRKGSPCETVWEYIDKKGFETKEEALEYGAEHPNYSKGSDDHYDDCVQNYPWEPTFDEQVKNLREQGLSRNKISKELHASHNRVQQSLEKQSISGKFFRAVGSFIKKVFENL